MPQEVHCRVALRTLPFLPLFAASLAPLPGPHGLGNGVGLMQSATQKHKMVAPFCQSITLHGAQCCNKCLVLGSHLPWCYLR